MSPKEKITTGVLMSLVMAFALSGFFVLTKVGFTEGWYSIWLKSFVSAWPVALILSLLVGKPVGLLSSRVVRFLPW